MSDRPPPLTPYPLEVLLGRVAREWETQRRIFDLPAARFRRAPDDLDLSTPVAGRRVATPFGPAAGPHTQLAQNIALGWLAGARSFELKTVQILDELDIPRPCIDMATVGFNVEWSQELTLERSREEYVKAWMMLDVLRHWPGLREEIGEPRGHAFELSVGYDLAGVRSDRVAALVDGLCDAGPTIDALRGRIPEPFARMRDHPFCTDVVRSATISTFHGCPPEEIEAIVRHLMTRHGLDVTVKLNPTLLGQERVEEILRGRLGYDDLQLVDAAFAEDLGRERALAMIRDLDAFARARGRVFGIKLTNTLVVENRTGRLPGERAYLSGPPLHALAIALLDDLCGALPGLLRLGPAAAREPDGADGGTVPVAFSAGVGRDNAAETAALGLSPVTVCSDLLQPGGYGRLTGMLRRLEKAMRERGARDLAAYLEAAEREARESGHRDAVAAYAARLATAEGARPYARVANSKPPRQVDVPLQPFDCSSCDLCVGVCPDDAMLRIPTPPSLAGELAEKRQYVCLAELCNSCGNCETFCPERGDPSRVKPRLYLSPDRFASASGQAWLVAPAGTGASCDGGSGGSCWTLRASAEASVTPDRLRALLDGPPGLPLRPEDMPGGGRSGGG